MLARLRANRFVLAAGVATITVVTCFAWILLKLGGPVLTNAADDGYSTLVPAAAAVACWWAASRRRGRPRWGGSCWVSRR